MKYIYHLILNILILLLVLFASKQTIFANFTNGSIPILDLGSTWDKQSIVRSYILIENDVYRLWYSGFDGNKTQIGHTSSFNLHQFTNQPFPIIPYSVLNTTDQGVSGPSVVKLSQSNYKMWFTRSLNTFSVFKIAIASSTNGIDWTDYQDIIFNTTSDWDSVGRTSPTVLYNNLDNSYYMWFTALGRYNNDVQRWRVGYASSTNGIEWTKHSTPVLDASEPWESSIQGEGVGNSMVLYKNNIYHMWYDSAGKIGHAVSFNGINWTKNPDNPVLVASSNPTAFDNFRVNNAEVFEDNNKFYMLYTGRKTDNTYRLGLAESDTLPSITPEPLTTNTPTPTPTPTNSPTPTPTPTIPLFSPIIMIPGLGGSINIADIASCSLRQSHDWILTPKFGEDEYNPILNALTDAGLTREKDFYLFTYDWRQQPDILGNKLNIFIQQIQSNHPTGTKFRLVGHSLGGIVIRSYLSNYGSSFIDSAITVGTPHQGTLKVYPLWEAGNTKNLDMRERIAFLHVFTRCKYMLPISKLPTYVPLPVYLFSSNRSVIHQQTPIVQSLLPIFDYLRKNGTNVPENSMNHRNMWLPLHPLSDDFIMSSLTTLSGNGFSTERFYDVVDPSWNDKRKGDWTDGKIKTTEYIAQGDGTVLLSSSQLDGSTMETLAADHGGIISSKEGVEVVLKHLGLPTSLVQTLSTLQLVEPSSVLIITVKKGKLSVTNPPPGSYVGENLAVLLNPTEGDYGMSVLSDSSDRTILGTTYFKKNEEEKTNFFPIQLQKKKSAKFKIGLGKLKQWLPQLKLAN